MKKRIQVQYTNTNTDCIHLTIISYQCCFSVILMQEIFPKEKSN